MVLESTMICLDNSDWMRNGDYVPSRMEAQQDAAGILCNDRTTSNAENTVGILTMAGDGIDLRVSPTEEIGKILASFAGIPIGGRTDLTTAVQIAQLALKHRKNKNGGQRIVVFVGSPVGETVEGLQRIGRQLKKNSVAIDIVSMGETEENNLKLLELVQATNSNDNSHLITVPAGISPAHALTSSDIMHLGGFTGGMGSSGEASNSSSSMGADGFNYDGFDPAMDPELAMAIRVSTEEARAHEEARLKLSQEQQQPSSSGPVGGSSTETFSSPGLQTHSDLPQLVEDLDEDDEDALIQRALEMSMRDMMTLDSTSEGANSVEEQEDLFVDGDEMLEEDEEDELLLALQLSVSESKSSSEQQQQAASSFVDPDFVSQLLGAADQSDPLIQEALAQMMNSSSSSNTAGQAVDTKEEDKPADDEEGEGADKKEETSRKRKGT